VATPEVVKTTTTALLAKPAVVRTREETTATALLARPAVVRAREETTAMAVEVSKAWARVVMTATE